MTPSSRGNRVKRGSQIDLYNSGHLQESRGAIAHIAPSNEDPGWFRKCLFVLVDEMSSILQNAGATLGISVNFF